MIIIDDNEKCCGCSACATVCGRKAIEMKPDALGFLYPEVNKDLCNDCGLCEKACAFHPNYDKSQNLDTPDVYAVRHKKMSEIETSRSGAMFMAISDWILERGGVVYGVGYVDHFRVAHKRATTKEEVNEFKGSKYVQSDVNTTFSQVRNDLKKGLFVLFSGTPCQTSGLKSYLSILKTDVSKLYVCDLVCHGVPSPYFWRDYLAFIEKKQGKKATEVNFRDKSKLGWSAHKESFKFGDTYTYTYTYTFYQHIMFRHSCGVCHFTNFQRPSDITIADFWGWQNAIGEEFNSDNKGVSLVLINTAKAQILFSEIKDNVNYIKTDTKSCLQPNLQYPSHIHPKRDDFERDYIKYGLVYVCKKYGDMGFKAQWNYFKNDKKARLKKFIKKMIGR